MRFVPFLIVSSAMLPYLPGGLRVEHLLVPLLALFAFIGARHIRPETALSVGALIFSLFALALSSYFSWETGLDAPAFSSFVRLAMPALMLMAFPYVLSDVPDPLRRTCRAIIILSIVITVFAILSLYSGRVLGWLMLWVKSGEESVWEASRDVGRVTGIFNQPLEAGQFFSIALLALIYEWKEANGREVVLRYAGLAFILIGGAFCLSKNFLVLGTVLALIYAISIRLVSLRMAIALSVPIVISAPIIIMKYNANYIESLVDLYYKGGLLSAVTAGRFGMVQSDVSYLFSSIWLSDDWLLGRGLGSHLPLDNGYLEFFYQGGALALLGYLGFLGVLGWYGYRHRKSDDGKLLLFLILYVTGASFGGPAISANRANVALMILIAACMVTLRSGFRERRQRTRRHINFNLSRAV